MTGVSAADPEALATFAREARAVEQRLSVTAVQLGAALALARGRPGVPAIAALDQTLAALARAARDLDDRTGQIGEAFARADGAGIFRLVHLPVFASDSTIGQAVLAMEAHRSVGEWRARAATAAGIDFTHWQPRLGLDANDANVQRMYDFYGQLALDHPELQWAAMAHLAGAELYAGWQDLVAANHLPGPGRIAALQALARLPDGLGVVLGPILGGIIDRFVDLGRDEVDWFISRFLTMAGHVFADLAWQHQAYAEGGIVELRRLHDDGALDDGLLAAWEQIARGDPAQVRAGNVALVRREQAVILQPDYDEIRRHDGPVGESFTRLLSWTSDSPVPGGRPYRDVVTTTVEVPSPLAWTDPVGSAIRWLVDGDPPTVTVAVPRGDVSKLGDRWEWIMRDMVPAFERLESDDPDKLEELLETPVATLAARHRKLGFLTPP